MGENHATSDRSQMGTRSSSWQRGSVSLSLSGRQKQCLRRHERELRNVPELQSVTAQKAGWALPAKSQRERRLRTTAADLERKTYQLVSCSLESLSRNSFTGVQSWEPYLVEPGSWPRGKHSSLAFSAKRLPGMLQSMWYALTLFPGRLRKL